MSCRVKGGAFTAAAVLVTALFAAVSFAVEPSINPELKAHTDRFKKKVYKVADNVYSAVGWNLANTIMIEGDAFAVWTRPTPHRHRPLRTRDVSRSTRLNIRTV